MDKVLFWRHKEIPMETPHDLGLGKSHDLGLGLEEEPALGSTPTPPSMPPTGMPPPSPPPPATSAFAQPQTTQASVDKDIQLVSAKLDSLKAILDNINQRLANIERIAQESQQHESF